MRLPLPKFPLLFIFLFLPAGVLFSQSGLKGKITDKKNLSIPFAVVYDETSLTGTTANTEGYYELKLDEGQHSLVIKAMGYYLIRKTVTITGKIMQFDFVLDEQPVAIKEVIVTPGKEDPAYAIMRKVIGLAPYHLNQVNRYTAEVYLRGTVHIEKIPKFIAKHTEVVENGVSIKIKSGDVFMSESLNRIEFEAPDKYKQTVLSIHSTFPGSGNNVDPMEIINSSLYEPEVDDFISPLAPNAFHYYKYAYEGFFDEGKLAIFKIKVTPKRNSQQLVNGYLYIVDQLWCLHSADVSAEMFFGKLNFKAIYSPVKSDAWLPVSYQFYVDAAMMGVKANYKYNSSVKFREVELNHKNPVARQNAMKEPVLKELPDDAKKTRNQQAIEDIMNKEDLTNRDMIKLSTLMAKETRKDTLDQGLEIKDEDHTQVTVEKDALKRDTGYWNTIRPIPLTQIETALPKIRKDSLVTTTSIKDSASLADSGAFKAALNRVSTFLTNGAGFYMFGKALHVHYDGLVGLKKFDFNTADGFVFRQSLTLDLRTDSTHNLKIMPGGAYGFSRQQFMWWTDVAYDYAPMRNGRIEFYIGSRSIDYNRESGINSTVNTISSLFFRRNYMKLFHENLAFLQNSIDMANGLNVKAGIGYRVARPINNNSDFSFFYHHEREYTENVPDQSPQAIARNLFHEEAFWEFSLDFTPGYYYKIIRGKKVYQHSKYPTLYLHNRMAVPGIVNSTADYDLLEVGIRLKTEWGMMHAFSWNIKGGFFLNQNRIFTMQHKYFNNQDLPVLLGNTGDAFRLVPYYRNATTGNFGEVHMRFTTPYLLIKYIPFLSNKLWCENIHFNYLTTEGLHHYWEAGYSISQIFLTSSVGVFAGFVQDKFDSAGIQFSIDF